MQHPRYLNDADSIVLNRQRDVNRANPVLPPQAWRHRAANRIPPPQNLTDPTDDIARLQRESEWRDVGHGNYCGKHSPNPA